MSVSDSALIVAVVGVAGTLLAPMFSQRMAARTQRDQFEQQRRVAQEDQALEQRRTGLSARRACYIATNSAARR